MSSIDLSQINVKITVFIARNQKIVFETRSRGLGDIWQKWRSPAHVSRRRMSAIYGPPAECNTQLHSSLYYTHSLNNEHPWLPNLFTTATRVNIRLWMIQIMGYYLRKRRNQFPKLDGGVTSTVNRFIRKIYEKRQRNNREGKDVQVRLCIDKWIFLFVDNLH